MGKRITTEQIKRIYELYDSGMTVYLHIAKEVGISDATVGKIIKERKASTAKICPKCLHESGKGARYCYYCGNDIRSHEELLLAKVEELRGMIVHLPENARSGFDATTREIMDYLKEKGA